MKMKFQVLDGKHQVFLKSKGAIRGKDVYLRGDIIETDENLVAMWNSPGCRKFARVHDDTPFVCSRPEIRRLDAVASPPVKQPLPRVEAVRDFSDHPESEQQSDDTFSGLTIAELTSIAAEEGIDLGDATRREDIRAKVAEHAGV